MPSERDFAGQLVIFVEGYGQADWRCMEINSPDSFFWMERGWAVGDNCRGRYCSRTAEKKMRKFHRFDDAVEYIFNRRRKRPKETFFLVYILGNLWSRVSTMDDILAIDTKGVPGQARGSFRQPHRSLSLNVAAILDNE